MRDSFALDYNPDYEKELKENPSPTNGTNNNI